MALNFVPNVLNMSLSGLVLGILGCLFLEIAGIQEGQNKQGLKFHVGILAICVCLWVFLCTLIYPPAKNTGFFQDTFFQHAWLGFVAITDFWLLIFAVLESEKLKKEKGEIYALSLSLLLLTTLFIFTKNPIALLMISSFMLFTFLAFLNTQIHPYLLSELSLKLSFLSLFICMVLWIGLILCVIGVSSLEWNQLLSAHTLSNPIGAAGLCIFLFGWLLFFGFFPLSGFHIDYLEGTPLFAFGFLSIHVLALAGLLLEQLKPLWPLLNPKTYEWLCWLAAASLVLPVALAGAQSRIVRLVAYFFIGNLGLLWCASLLEGNTIWMHSHLFYLSLNLFFILPSILLPLFCFILPDSRLTFENLAYSSKQSFWISFAFFLGLYNLLALPGTYGFYAKINLLKISIEKTHWVLGVALFLHTFIGFIALFRMVIFLFLKQPTRFPKKSGIEKVIAAFFICVFLILLDLFPFTPHWLIARFYSV